MSARFLPGRPAAPAIVALIGVMTVFGVMGGKAADPGISFERQQHLTGHKVRVAASGTAAPAALGGKKDPTQETEEEEKNIVLTIVYDNNPGDKELTTAWGFGCVVEGFHKTVLFDTGGRGDILLDNMAKLRMKPTDIDAVVLSHIHGDHTGGLAAFLEKNSDVSVFLPAAFPERFRAGVRAAGATVVETKDAREVCPGLFTTGVLGRTIVEQGLYLETADGIVVITGCAHPGIVNLARAAKNASAKPLYAVLGGFHMGGAPAREISRVIQQLKELGVERAGPCHCSGDKAREMMKEAFGENYIELGVGYRVSFPKAERKRE